MKTRRIIVNNDFYNIFQVEPPVTDQDVLNAVDRVAGTQAETLFFMAPTTIKAGDPISPELVWLYQHPESDPCIRNMHDYSASGRDAFAMLLERTHERGLEFFASFRMNDTHYLDQLFNPWVAQFYYDNLHNRIGGANAVGRQGTEFDYRNSAVREQMLGFIRDTVERYDVDGIELDCTRNCLFFPRGDVHSGLAAECAPIMTEFVRQVRACLNEIGERRGRKIHLCATIPGSLLHARREGLDIPVWARLGLLDMLCMSSPFLADFDRDIADTKLKVPGVQVYAGCDRNCDWPARAVPLETYRALASNYWQQGADGIYLYNVMIWTIDSTRLPAMLLRHGGQGATDYDRCLLDELGAPATLEGKDKLYLVSHRAEAADHPYSSLPVTVAGGEERTLRLRIGDDIARAALEGKIKSIALQIVSSDCGDYGNYTVLLNAVDLSRQYAFAAFAEKPQTVELYPEPNRSGEHPPLENVRRHPVRPIDVHTGLNFITIKSYAEPLIITDVELAIYYQ
jgi:hypothetical protein